jgi:hypothetical protein
MIYNTKYTPEENWSMAKWSCPLALASTLAVGAYTYYYGIDSIACSAISCAAIAAFKALSDRRSYQTAPPIPKGEIGNGYGEFIVYRSSEPSDIDEQTFNKAYEILNKYSFTQIAHDFEDDLVSETCSKRHEIVKKKVKEDAVHRISYGTGLFAGCQRDLGATAFCYAKKTKEIYVFPILTQHLKELPLFIPNANAICQLSAHGETFHASTLAWEGADLRTMTPCGAHPEKIGKFLKSNLSREELLKKFYKIRQMAISL